MADPLSLLRKYYINKKPIIERNNQIIFDECSWPKTAKTNYHVTGPRKGGTPEKYYTLECLLFFLKNKHLSHPEYVTHAAAVNIPAVRRPDRKELLRYLTGVTNTARGIDKNAPVEIPSGGKRKNNDVDSSRKLKFTKLCSESENKEQETSKCESPIFGTDVYESSSKAGNFNTLKKLSEEVKKILKISEENAYDIIFSAALNSNIEDLIDLKFSKQTDSDTSSSPEMYFCEFFIGTTKLAFGEGENRYFAKSKASEKALHILKNLEEPPKKSKFLTQKQTDECIVAHSEAPTSSSRNKINRTVSSKFDSKASQSVCERDILKRLAFDIRKGLDSRKLPVKDHISIIHNHANRLNIFNDVVYKISEEENKSGKHNILFLCDLFIKNTLIGQGEGVKVKLAKQEAAANGYNYLLKLIENCLDETEISNSSNKKFGLSNISKAETPKNKKDGLPIGFKSSFEEVTSAHNDTVGPFSLNKALINNSFRLQFAIFDRSELEETADECDILKFSANMCQKDFSYNCFSNGDGTIRVDILFDLDIVGTGIGKSKQSAKAAAARNALESLKKQVYTVKVKSGTEEVIKVHFEDLVDLRFDSLEAVYNNSVGSRLLKMLGFSDDGVGKNQRIYELICARSQNFEAGNMDLISRIEILLEIYSKLVTVIPLKFSREFAKVELREIQRVAEKFNLIVSFGENTGWRVLVRKKSFLSRLLGSILRAGGSTERYELVDMSQSEL